MKPPVIRLDRVWHVGDLEAPSKRRNSYEGAGLSVSVHPAAWRMIARGWVDGPTWQMDRKNSRFLDALTIGPKMRREILTWAESQGYAHATDLWTWTYWDDELEEEVHQVFLSRKEALDEADCDDEDDGIIKVVRGHVSTPALDVIAMQDSPSRGSRAVLDLVLPVYAEQVLGLDGVWWAERLDPLCHSAPRGVIAAGRVQEWSVTRCDADPDENDSY